MRPRVETMRFGSLRITFDERVLRPRPWTEAQSEWAAELLRHAPAGDVLELCTGAGHIGLLAIVDSDRRLIAVDANPVAVEHARANAADAGLADRVEVRLGRLEEVVASRERFAVVVADPPWVTSAGVADLPEDPESAIDGGHDGLDVARLCVEVVEAHLAVGGAALLQLGTVEQAETIGGWAQDRGVLRPSEMRTFDRGVLVRLDRAATRGEEQAGTP